MYHTPAMQNAHHEEKLKRVIGIPALTLSFITAMIGGGIFALPGTVGGALGMYGLFNYLSCGFLISIVMFCYVELGSRITSSGGTYAYVEAAFGPFIGYVVNWMYFFGWGIIGSAALLNIGVSSIASLFPFFEHPAPRCLLFLGLTMCLITLNVAGAKQGVGVVKVITIAKLLPLIGLIVFGFSHVRPGNLQFGPLPGYAAFSDTALILYFAFAGFETALGASGEIKSPERSIPVSICIAGAIVMIFYLLLQTLAQGVLGNKLAFFKDAPLAAVANQIIGPVGATVLLVCSTVSSVGNVSLDVLCTPRSLYAGANDGLFPKFLGKVHPRFATPHLAIIVYGVLIFIFAISGGFDQLAILANGIILLVYVTIILATVKLRNQTAPETGKTFRMPGGLITPIIGLIGITWLLSRMHKKEILATFAFIAIVCVLYLAQAWIKRKKASLQSAKDIFFVRDSSKG